MPRNTDADIALGQRIECSEHRMAALSAIDINRRLPQLPIPAQGHMRPS